MTTVSDMLYHLGGVPVATGIPFGKNSRAFFVDPTNGSDTLSGETPLEAKATVTAAYNLTTDGANDVVFFIAGATADNPSATLTWSKNYTHLIGMSSPLPGVGQRCRIVGTAGNDLSPVVTVSGAGCIFANLQVYNGKDADSDSGAVLVSGNRNAFWNVFFAGMAHATPAARAGSYSLTVSGAENHFERCYIGLDTIVRAAANAELIISGSKNSFWDCRVASYSETAGKFAVTISGAGTHEFKDCLFHNMSVNWAQALTDAFNVTASATHYIILRGNCQFVGYTGVANTVTHIYGAGPAPNGGMFLSTQPSA